MTTKVTTNKLRYSAFGLNFVSDIELPELVPFESDDERIVEIVYGQVPKELDEPVDTGGLYSARPGVFLLSMEGIGRFLVEGGSKITIERSEGAVDVDVRVFLLGSCFGALLHQRGILAFHSSAIVVDGQAVLFSGPSGVGKSTTAAAFGKKGYQVLADDITAISLGEDGRPLAHPGLRRLKLWRDSVNNLEYEPKELSLVRPGTINRFCLPSENFCKEPVPLRSIFVLNQWNKEEFGHAQEGPAKSFNVVLRNTYRSRFLDGLEARPAHFQVAAAVCKHASVHLVKRPDHPFQVEELLELVLEKLE